MRLWVSPGKRRLQKLLRMSCCKGIAHAESAGRSALQKVAVHHATQDLSSEQRYIVWEEA